MVGSVRFLWTMAVLAVLAAGALTSCGEPEKPSDVGVKKPLPSPPTGGRPAQVVSTPVTSPVPSAPAPTPATTGTVITPEGHVQLAPPEISPDAAWVFEEMDRAFADSKTRQVDIQAGVEMYSAVRSYRSRIVMQMQLQFPNLMNIRGLTNFETNDPQTTTTWSPSKVRWGLLSDGDQMLVMKGFMVTQRAPATLDDVLTEQIEIESWGSNELINCFLKTRPSEAFIKPYLKRARVAQRSGEQVVLELVMQPPLPIQQRYEIPPTFDVIHMVTIDARRMIPVGCFIDHASLGREILLKTKKREVPVERAIVEVIVKDANLKADFTGQSLFVLPESAPRLQSTSPTVPGSLPFRR